MDKLVAQNRFDYLVGKIRNASFVDFPYKHIYIEDFFESKDFNEIILSPEINTTGLGSDSELFLSLYGRGYKIISFPGCITDEEVYRKWHKSRNGDVLNNTACEGFGMTLRLYSPATQVIAELKDFMASESFNRAIAEKFGLDYREVTVDGGIQKYLDGYEISPHPDIRRKAATFMVNINPSSDSETMDHHTHYMRFVKERKYVQSFWEGNEKIERGWVPWGWCETLFQQTKNNSIVLFSPGNDTLHAVKASYDHLKTQRTQLYGNLWFKVDSIEKKLEWEGLDFVQHAKTQSQARSGPLKSLLSTITRPVRKIWNGFKRDRDNIGERPFR